MPSPGSSKLFHGVLQFGRIAVSERGGLTVPGVQNRDTAGEVDVAPALDVPEFGILGIPGEDRCGRSPTQRVDRTEQTSNMVNTKNWQAPGKPGRVK